MLNVGEVCNFEVYPSAVLTNFKAVTILGIVKADIASSFIDIHAMHRMVFPYLPVGTPNDPTAYDYVIFKTSADVKTVLGIPWIKADTIVAVEEATAVVKIHNITTADFRNISDILLVNGYSNFTIAAE